LAVTLVVNLVTVINWMDDTLGAHSRVRSVFGSNPKYNH